MNKLLIFCIILFGLIFCSACQEENISTVTSEITRESQDTDQENVETSTVPDDDQQISPTETDAPPEEPTVEELATATATTAPTNTPTRVPGDAWERQATPLPIVSIPINAASAADVQQLARWGKGSITPHDEQAIRFSDDGLKLGIQTSAGLFLYDAVSLAELPVDEQIWEAVFSELPMRVKVYIANMELWRGDQLILELPNTDVHFSPGGTWATTYDYDKNTIGVWNTITGEQMVSLEISEKFPCWNEDLQSTNFSGMALMPDGVSLAGYCEYTHSLLIIDDQGQVRQDINLEGLDESISPTRWYFSTAGTLLAGASYDGFLAVWQIPEGKLLVQAGESDVRAMSFSPDLHSLVIGYGDGRVLVWDLNNMQTPYILHPMAPSGEAVAFSPDGSWLATLFPPKLVALDPLTGRWLHEIEWNVGNDGFYCSDLAFSSDGHYFACLDYGVFVWEMPDFSPVKELQGNCCMFQFYADTYQLGVMQENIVLLEMPEGSAAGVVQVPEQFLSTFTFSPDGSQVVLGAVESYLENHQTLLTLDVDKKGRWKQSTEITLPYPWKMSYSPSGEYLAVIADDELQIFNTKKWDLLFQKEKEFQFYVDDALYNRYGLVFSPDGSILASGSGRNIHLRRTSDWTLLATLEDHQGLVTSLTFSPDGNLLVSGSLDGTLRVWGIPGD